MKRLGQKSSGWAACLLLYIALNAAGQLPCQVESFHDGNGLYTYTFHRGDLPYVWRLAPHEGALEAICMQFYGIREVVQPAGWSNSVSPAGMITWAPSEAPVFLDEPVIFSVRSCLAETASYDYWQLLGMPADPYPRGIINGAVYELPGRTNFLDGGYQNFVFTGPARPTLFVEQGPSRVSLSWSTLSRECQLEYCDVLQPQHPWEPVTNSPVVIGTNFTVTLPVNSSRVFRLSFLNVR